MEQFEEELMIDEIDDDIDEGYEDEAADTEEVEEIEPQTPPEKKYDDKDLDSILSKKIARERSKKDKEIEKIKAELERAKSIIQAGTGEEDPDKAVTAYEQYLRDQGVEIPEYNQELTPRRIAVIANDEAREIIESGYEDVVEETDRLAAIGRENWNAIEQARFMELAEARTKMENQEVLQRMGLKEDIFEDADFIAFREKFNNKTPIAEVYQLYKATMKKQRITKDIGDITSKTAKEPIKDFYSYKESLNFTRQDLDKNPALLKAIKNSMPKW